MTVYSPSPKRSMDVQHVAAYEGIRAKAETFGQTKAKRGEHRPQTRQLSGLSRPLVILEGTSWKGPLGSSDQGSNFADENTEDKRGQATYLRSRLNTCDKLSISYRMYHFTCFLFVCLFLLYKKKVTS